MFDTIFRISRVELGGLNIKIKKTPKFIQIGCTWRSLIICLDYKWTQFYEIDPFQSIGKVAKENLHTMTEELKAFEQERKRRKATESRGSTYWLFRQKRPRIPFLSFINKALMNMVQLPLNVSIDSESLSRSCFH